MPPAPKAAVNATATRAIPGPTDVLYGGAFEPHLVFATADCENRRMGVPREKLFEEIWAEPMTAVATRYNVSSSYLARICE
jgi:hypothetical protein